MAHIDIVFLLKKAIEKRESLREITDAVRLVNSQGDAIEGIMVEQYNRHFVLHKFPAASEKTIHIITDHLINRFDPDYFIIKQRQITGGREYDDSCVQVVIDKKGSRTIVSEYDLKFQVDLNDTLNTGLFLDMRHNRRLIARLSSEKEVLNTFAYTCAFGLHCRTAGASRVVNVDISAKILDRGRNNYSLNNVQPLENEFVRADAVRYMKGAVKRENRFDCVIIDPPTFARVNREIFSVTREIPDILGLAFSIIKPGGHILVATNCSSLTPAILGNHIKTCAQRSGALLHDITRLEQDIDFPGGGSMKESFLSCFCFQVK
jgi:23S rRNA (cytosine1962-C5)-methyltransferase